MLARTKCFRQSAIQIKDPPCIQMSTTRNARARFGSLLVYRFCFLPGLASPSATLPLPPAALALLPAALAAPLAPGVALAPSRGFSRSGRHS